MSNTSLKRGRNEGGCNNCLVQNSNVNIPSTPNQPILENSGDIRHEYREAKKAKKNMTICVDDHEFYMNFICDITRENIINDINSVQFKDFTIINVLNNTSRVIPSTPMSQKISWCPNIRDTHKEFKKRRSIVKDLFKINE